MLRSLGIPAREAVGYVPGGYNPITDLYQVHADDAHAWVQVWFPGYGWQSFDPTAVVPPSNPSPGATALNDVASALRRVPWVPVAAVLVGTGLWSSCSSAGAGHARRRGRSGWQRSASGPGGGRAGPAGRRDPGRVRHPPRRAGGGRVDDLGPAGLVGGGQRLRGPRAATAMRERAMVDEAQAHPGPPDGPASATCGR